MTEQNVLTSLQTLLNLIPQLLVNNIVGPIKISQIQMPSASLPHTFRLQNKPLAFSIHNVKRGLAIIKTIRQRFVQRIIGIFNIERGHFLTILFHRTFYCIRPRAHIIQIGLRNRQTVYGSACWKIQIRRWKHLVNIRNTLRLSRHNQWKLHHCSVSFIALDIFLRVSHRGQLTRHHSLKIGFTS